MELRILGELEVRDRAGRPVPLAGPPARLLLRLLAAPEEPVPLEELADALWWPGPWPERAGDQLHRHLTTLRRTLEAAGGTPGLRSTADGWIVAIGDGRRDDEALAALVVEAAAALEQGQLDVARELAGRAVDLARGPALADVAGLPWAVAAARQLDDLLAEAARLRLAARVALGRVAEVETELEPVLAADPTDQAAWVALAAARFLGGDRVAALTTVRRARLRLGRSGGTGPGPVLRALEAAVLADDPDRVRHLVLDPAAALPNVARPTGASAEGWRPLPPRPAGAALPPGPADTVEPGAEDRWGHRIGRRVALLPAETQRLLTLAAVAGATVDAVLLARAAGLPVRGLAAHLEPAVAAGVLRADAPEDAVAFVSPEVAEAVTAGLSAFRRQQIHVLLAQASASLPDRPPGERDHHLGSAADLALP